MTKLISIIALSVMAASVGACGKADAVAAAATTVVSCTNPSPLTDVCIEYTGTDYTSVTGNAAIQAACTTELSGTYAATTCSATNKVGTCTLYSATATEQKSTYYSPTFTAASAEAACTASSGTFGAATVAVLVNEQDSE